MLPDVAPAREDANLDPALAHIGGDAQPLHRVAQRMAATRHDEQQLDLARRIDAADDGAGIVFTLGDDRGRARKARAATAAGRVPAHGLASRGGFLPGGAPPGRRAAALLADACGEILDALPQCTQGAQQAIPDAQQDVPRLLRERGGPPRGHR